MTKTCLACGKGNPNGAKFCTSCGEVIKNVTETSQSFSSGVQEGTQQTDSNCLWCGQNRGYKEEEGKLDSKWGFTAHKMKIFVCNNCGYAHLFGLGRSIWDFD